jgi:isopenicillin-N epimerase
MDRVSHVPSPLLTRDGRPARDLWPLDQRLRHLNHGSFGAVPIAALTRQQDLKTALERDPMGWFLPQPGRIGDARAAIAPHLGVAADRFALVPNTSAGISAALHSLPVPTAGKEVVITDHGYGAVTMGVERFARRYGLVVRTAHVPLAADADETFDAIWSTVTDLTTLMVVDQLTSPTARLMPVKQLCAAARERNIPTIVDAAHVPMMIANAIADADADYWVGNLHKYACTPRGTAVLTAHPAVSEEVEPLINSWGSGMSFPQRFDHQATDDMTGWLAAPVALEHLEAELGWDRIRDHATSLAGWAQGAIAGALAEVFDEPTTAEVGMPAGPIRLVRLPARLGPDRLGSAELRDRMMTVGFRTSFTAFDGVGYLRLTAHAYNTADDYLDFIDRGLPLLCSWAR